MSQWQNDPIFNLNCKEVSRSVCEEVARNRNPVHPSGTCTITFYLCFFKTSKWNNEDTVVSWLSRYLKWGWHTVTYFDAEAIPWYSATSCWTFGEALSRPQAVKTMLSWKGSNSAKVSIHLLIVVDACGDWRSKMLSTEMFASADRLQNRPLLFHGGLNSDQRQKVRTEPPCCSSCVLPRFSLGQLPLTQRWSSIFLCSIGSEIMRGCWCLFWWCELSSADPDFEGQTCLPKCMFFMAWSMKHEAKSNPKAGGIGLNLTAASHVVHFDRCWNPAKEAQARAWVCWDIRRSSV